MSLCGTLQVALAPPRAHGLPPACGVLRREPEDFCVEEQLGFAPSGSGQHLLLKVRKRNANTAWVARQLARLAGCHPGEVGYAGLKDRRAVAVQWFSVPRPRTPVSWAALPAEECAVLEEHGHGRKLPRGALAGNHFSIRIGAAQGDGANLAARLAPRLTLLERHGVPNYFGPQRFGRDGGNLARSAVPLAQLGRAERGFVLSAARSAIFNALLAERVRDGSWQQLLPGDLAALEGRGSFFAIEQPDEVLAARCRQLEIHPTGALWGEGSPPSAAAVQALESQVAQRLPAQSALCVAAGMRQERRSLRLRLCGLQLSAEPQSVLLRFGLARGCFATAVLRELLQTAADELDL